MDWNNVQNFLSNIVFGILFFTMIFYWISLFFLDSRANFSELEIIVQL